MKILAPSIVCAFSLAILPAAAQDPLVNFKTAQAPSQGTSYTAVSIIPAADLAQVFSALQRVVARNGWAVFHMDQSNNTILARNGQTTANGKTGDLGASLMALNNGISLALIYTNPPGVNSPADSVRAEFAKIATGVLAETGDRSAPKASASSPSARQVATDVAAQSSTPAVARKLCLANACLGMTISEASALNLQPAGTFQFGFNTRLASGFGLDRNGKRITFSEFGDFDNKSIKQFTSTVDTICAISFANAKLKASDGQPINLTFRPSIRDGKGVLILSQIDRKLPPNMSDSELQRFEASARDQFGEAFSGESQYTVSRPTAEIHYDFGLGRSLRLSQPIENLRNRLMEQAGCSDKPRLD